MGSHLGRLVVLSLLAGVAATIAMMLPTAAAAVDDGDPGGDPGPALVRHSRSTDRGQVDIVADDATTFDPSAIGGSSDGDDGESGWARLALGSALVVLVVAAALVIWRRDWGRDPATDDDAGRRKGGS